MSTGSLDVPMTMEPARARSAPVAAIAIGLVTIVCASVGLSRGVEPFATWFYQFAWFSVLLVMEGCVARSGVTGARGEFLLLGRPRHLLSVLCWSAVVWYFYELLNFRLQNWYYVNLPVNGVIRWASTAVAFATVLPAVFLSSTLMRAAGVAENTRWKPVRIADRLHWLRFAGAIMMSLVLVWPKYFFPLVWGATTLLVEPWVYRKSAERSLLHDLEKGEPGRILRLLAGGVLIGFLWESLNIAARAKWIYTVPGLEDLKLFEMPLLGFLGFPPFTLECFVLWQAAVVGGVATSRSGERFPAPLWRRVAIAAAAIVFCAGIMWRMDTQTIASQAPQLSIVAGDAAPAFRSAGYDVYELAHAEPGRLAAQVGVPQDTAAAIVARARVVTLRGIGTHYADLLNRAGVTTVEQLASAQPARLEERLREAGEAVQPARIRIWVKGARHALERERASRQATVIAPAVPAVTSPTGNP